MTESVRLNKIFGDSVDDDEDDDSKPSPSGFGSAASSSSRSKSDIPMKDRDEDSDEDEDEKVVQKRVKMKRQPPHRRKQLLPSTTPFTR